MSRQVIADTGGIKNEIVDKSNLNFTELYTLVESTGDLLFDKPFGRRYGTWDTPVTGDLVIDETGAQDGYCVVVVWSGDTTPNVTGGARGCVNGSIDEQAIYNIYFNRIDGRYNVNILKQSTATATAPTITATQDIDSVITVTNPSVLEFDTLLGYNNYSDIDGQLGTTMTPTEATNGHTVTLSDGVVHGVTTKPVGTTNGEFTAVVSNAVTVDLSGGGSTPITFTTFNPSISEESAEVYINTQTTYVSIASSDLTAGDFDFSVLIDDSAVDKDFMFGVSNIGHDSWNSSAGWPFGVWVQDDGTIQVLSLSNIDDPDTPTTITWQSGDVIRLVRVGSGCKIYLNTTEIHSFVNTNSDDIQYMITPTDSASGYKLRQPRLN